MSYEKKYLKEKNKTLTLLIKNSDLLLEKERLEEEIMVQNLYVEKLEKELAFLHKKENEKEKYDF